jgi:hypothetical protein
MATSEDVETLEFLVEKMKKNNLRKKELQNRVDEFQGSSKKEGDE